MANPGVHVYEQATAVSTPAVAQVGIPFVVGTAPVHTAENPAKANVPVLVTSWKEAVQKLGYSEDWKTYTLCEFMYSHFQLYGCQPVIFCNVLDTAKAKSDTAAKDYAVTNHKATLPFELTNPVVKSGESALTKDEDYTVFYDDGACIVELLSSGTAYNAETLNIAGTSITPDTISSTDIVEGLGVIDSCMSMAGLVPDLICVPGYSHISTVAAIMAPKPQVSTVYSAQRQSLMSIAAHPE